MSNLKVDNLTKEVSASEMEQAILELQNSKTDIVKEEVPKEAVETEAVEEKSPKAQVETEAPLTKEFVEDKVDSFDYKKGYEGLRSLQTRLAQDVADLKRGIRPEAPKAEPAIAQNDWDEWHAVNPSAANAWLAQQNIKPLETQLLGMQNKVNTVLAREAISRFQNSHNDFESLREDIFEGLNVYPKEMLDNPDHFDTILDNAYWAAKGRRIQINEARVREDERAKISLKQRQKSEAVVEGPVKAVIEERLDPAKMSSDELMMLMRAKGVGPQDL